MSRRGVADITLAANPLKKEDEIYIIGPTTGVYQGKVKEIRVDEKNTDEAKQGEICSIPVDSLVRRADKLYKVVDNL